MGAQPATPYDISKESPLLKERTYFHITHPDNVERILKEGLLADEDGFIFAYITRIVEEDIALNQLGISPYAVFGINPMGITGKIIRDRVAEFTAPYHRIIVQDRIPRRYLTLLDKKVTIDFSIPSPWDIFLIGRLRRVGKKKAVKIWHEQKRQMQEGGAQ